MLRRLLFVGLDVARRGSDGRCDDMSRLDAGAAGRGHPAIDRAHWRQRTVPRTLADRCPVCSSLERGHVESRAVLAGATPSLGRFNRDRRALRSWQAWPYMRDRVRASDLDPCSAQGLGSRTSQPLGPSDTRACVSLECGDRMRRPTSGRALTVDLVRVTDAASHGKQQRPHPHPLTQSRLVSGRAANCAIAMRQRVAWGPWLGRQ